MSQHRAFPFPYQSIAQVLSILFIIVIDFSIDEFIIVVQFIKVIFLLLTLIELIIFQTFVLIQLIVFQIIIVKFFIFHILLSGGRI